MWTSQKKFEKTTLKIEQKKWTMKEKWQTYDIKTEYRFEMLLRSRSKRYYLDKNLVKCRIETFKTFPKKVKKLQNVNFTKKCLKKYPWEIEKNEQEYTKNEQIIDKSLTKSVMLRTLRFEAFEASFYLHETIA